MRAHQQLRAAAVGQHVDKQLLWQILQQKVVWIVVQKRGFRAAVVHFGQQTSLLGRFVVIVFDLFVRIFEFRRCAANECEKKQ